MTKFSYRILPFSQRLFLSVIFLFLGYAVCFMLFQYKREKAYKIELLNTQLQNYNNQLCDFLADHHGVNSDSMQSYVTTHMMPNLRVTLIEPSGKVVYDNTNANWKSFANHSSRKEVQDALMYGSGYSISRQSESIQGEEYFYSARYYPPYRIIIRSALPYNLSLAEHLQADSGYLWFALIICLVLIFIFYRFTRKLGKSITKLQQFAMKADRNEPIDMDILQTFPKNELGEISQHIIKIYKRLHRAKEALYIEREKLISHLQTSHEGLGVFTKERQEILVNNLFTQYINNISDRNLRSTNEIFDIPELQPIIEFLNRNEGNFSKEEKRYAMHLNKNARLGVYHLSGYVVRNIHQRYYPGRRTGPPETSADSEHRPRAENARQQYSGIPGNHYQQPEHSARKCPCLPGKKLCPEQPPDLPATRHLCADPNGRGT